MMKMVVRVMKKDMGDAVGEGDGYEEEKEGLKEEE